MALADLEPKLQKFKTAALRCDARFGTDFTDLLERNAILTRS